jgi:hypothetical protein
LRLATILNSPGKPLTATKPLIFMLYNFCFSIERANVQTIMITHIAHAFIREIPGWVLQTTNPFVEKWLE